MVRFNDLIGNFLFAALMFVALFGLIVVVQADNNAVNPIVDNPIFGGENGTFNKLQEKISDVDNNSSAQYEAFSNEKPDPSFGSIVLFTIAGVGKTFGSLTIDIFEILVKLPVIVLGIDPNILSIISSWLAIVLVLASWAVYKFGG